MAEDGIFSDLFGIMKKQLFILIGGILYVLTLNLMLCLYLWEAHFLQKCFAPEMNGLYLDDAQHEKRYPVFVAVA